MVVVLAIAYAAPCASLQRKPGTRLAALRPTPIRAAGVIRRLVPPSLIGRERGDQNLEARVAA